MNMQEAKSEELKDKNQIKRSKHELKDLIWEAEEIAKIISASILTMKEKRQLTIYKKYVI